MAQAPVPGQRGIAELRYVQHQQPDIGATQGDTLGEERGEAYKEGEKERGARY